MEVKSRVALIDYLKAICMILVITEHNGIDFGFFIPTVVYMSVPTLMIITGYNYASQYQNSLGYLYRPKILLKKLWRIYRPWTIVFLAICVGLIYNGRAISFNPLIAYLGGGLWYDYFKFAGNYYIAVMVQIIIIAPLLILISRRYGDIKGLILIIAISVIFEIAVLYLQLDDEIYRVLACRYFIYVYSGILIRKKRKRILNKASIIVLLCAMCIGLIFVITTYYGLYEPIIFQNWTKTSLPVILWVCPIVYFLFCILPDEWRIKQNGIHNIFTLIGKSSFHIFLVQGVYFGYINYRVRVIAIEYITNELMQTIFLYMFSLCFSIAGGIIFYKIEKGFDNCIKMRLSQEGE